MAWVLSVIVIFSPSTTNVFFCRFGLKTRLVRLKEKLTLWPDCLPLPVSSHRDAMVYSLYVNLSIFSIVAVYEQLVKMLYN